MTSKVLDKLKDKVDKTIIKLADPNFRKDPIGGKYGFVTSVIEFFLQKTWLNFRRSDCRKIKRSRSFGRNYGG